MTEKEKNEIFMQFITVAMENSLKLVKNIKDIDNVKDIKLEVCQYALQFAENIKDLGLTLQKDNENGNTEH